MKEFKKKLINYLKEQLLVSYEEEIFTDEIILDLFYEFIQDSDIVKEQLYISFSLDSFTAEPGEFEDNGGALLGFRTVNGLHFLGVLAGGDWEIPVFFIVFFNEHEELVVYIPERGNLFNKFTLEAYDIEGDVHEMGLKYRWGEIQKDIQEKTYKEETGKVYLEFQALKKKGKTLRDRSVAELNKMLEEALAEEEYLKAAEIKKELDDR